MMIKISIIRANLKMQLLIVRKLKRKFNHKNNKIIIKWKQKKTKQKDYLKS